MQELNGLRSRLKDSEFITSGNKPDIYRSCKMFSDCVVGGLSSLDKGKLVDFINNLETYKNNITTEDYKTFRFDQNVITLDEEQHQIVIGNTNTHVRIVAAAGSGKTTTILCRVKYLVDLYVPPSKILILTFNVDACQNLKNRIVKLFGFDVNVHIRTIDSFCAYIKWKYNVDSSNRKQNTSLSELGVDGEEIMLKYGKEISAEYKYVFFDEFQDVNSPQFNILKIFAENGCYLTVIGDDSQNIYQWRGSNNYYIINMDQILNGVNNNVITYSITTNYRSTPQIVYMANDSIKNNKIRLNKNMKPKNNDLDLDIDSAIELLIYKDTQEQFKNIMNIINSYMKKYRYKYDDFAILSRNGTYLKIAEETFQKYKLPYIALITDKSNLDDKKPTIQHDKITITTIHRAKGLEWKCVFMVGLCDTHFPSHMNNNIKNIEEERRLFYVGITRAKTFLYFVTNTKEIPITRFIQEIFDDHVHYNYNNNKSNLSKQDIFGHDDNNNPKLKYSVTEIIKLLQGEQLREMRTLNLIPNTAPTVTSLFDNVLDFNDQIKLNYFESDFGEFCDRLLTRYIMIKQELKLDLELRDLDTECVINGIDLTKEEMEVYNKYNIEGISLQYLYEVKEIRKYLIENIINKQELDIALRICNKLEPNKEIRRCETYPKIFTDKLKRSYDKYKTSKYKTENILNDVYYVSLCRKFMDERRRLIYRDIFDVFAKDFDKIHERIKQYALMVSNNETECKTSMGHICKINRDYVRICGELDMIDLSNKVIVDFKCSESEFKVEWLIQTLLYYSLLVVSNQISSDDITKVSIFNILQGKTYDIPIPIDYDCESLINYVKKLIEKDMKSSRDNDQLDLEFLKNYGKNIISMPNIQKPDIKGFGKMIQNLNPNNNYLCFDVETGIFGTTSDIIQLAYIVYDSEQKEIKRFNKYVKDRIVEKRAFETHGITADILNKFGIDFDDIIYEFLTDLNNCKYIIGHNVSSDMRHIRSNITKYNIPITYDPFEGKQKEDTMLMHPKRLKLCDLHKVLFNKDMKNAHDALGDVEATAKCYFVMMDTKIDTNNEKKQERKTKKITVKGKKNIVDIENYLEF